MIYLDHHSATPMLQAVGKVMQEAAAVAWANPSSTHAAGRASRRLLEQARDAVAAAVGAASADLVLTGGGTEACNLGVRAVARGRRRIITSTVEHPAVAQSVARLENAGREVIRLGVPAGRPPPVSELSEHLDGDCAVAIQWVNHETGTLFPVEGYADACGRAGASLFVDATQALGKQAIDLSTLRVDALAIAGQKVGGPAGAGACYVRRGIEVEPVFDGGSQERGRRPGTPDTSTMAGFGEACRGVSARLDEQPRIATLRDQLESALMALGAVRNGGHPRVGTVTNLSFAGWKGAVLVGALDVEGVCVSAGAACSSGLAAPSPVLLAMYPGEQWRAGSAVRISLGIETTHDDIGMASQAFQRVLARKTS